jgi:hypothetical protein
MATTLDKLNSLLKTEKLNIPEFRSQIDKTGRNLHWVRRAVQNNVNASAELKQLVAMEMPQLVKEI